MPVQKHTHKYERIKLGKKKTYTVFKCALPGCTHYIEDKLLEGRVSICWDCGQPFVVVASLVRKKPLCLDCKVKIPVGASVPVSHDTASSFLSGLLKRSAAGLEVDTNIYDSGIDQEQRELPLDVEDVDTDPRDG